MQFRCYTCKLVMGEGIPPLEALDKDQAREVGIAAPETNYDMFNGTKFEGMSPYQFCTFCLTVYTSFPSMAMKDTGMRHDIDWRSNSMEYCNGGDVVFVWQNVTCTTCDKELIRKEIQPSKGQSFELFDDCLRSRASILHHVEVLYPNNRSMKDLQILMYIEA